MAPQRHGTGRWQTVLWIAWRAGHLEHQEPLCLEHRAYVFEHTRPPPTACGAGETSAACAPNLRMGHAFISSRGGSPRRGTILRIAAEKVWKFWYVGQPLISTPPTP